GFCHGLDLAYSDEFVMDHAFSLPLHFLRPEADIPIVPVFANTMAPPLPPPERFYQVGEALSQILEALPSDKRVCAILSGHLSLEVGGPRMIKVFAEGVLDWEFDARMADILGTGDVETLLRESAVSRLLEAGNVTTGFMTFVLAAGLAGGRPASHPEALSRGIGSMPFFRWDLGTLETP